MSTQTDAAWSDRVQSGPARNGGEARSAQRGSIVAWYSVVVCLVLYLFSQVDRMIINSLVGPIQTAFGIGDFKMGLLMGPAFGVAYVVATFPLAWLSDRVSRRAVVFGAIIFWSIAACASGLARSYGEFFTTRMAVGIGEAALMPAAHVLVSQLFSRERLATPLAVLSIGAVGGLAVAFGLGGWLSGTAGRMMEVPQFGTIEAWRLIFIVTGAPGLLLAFLIFTVPDARNRDAEDVSVEVPSQSWSQFFRRHRRVACGILLGFGCVAICSGALIAWLPTYLVRTHGWSTMQAGMAAGLLVLMVCPVGKVASGLIVDHWFARGIFDAHLRYFMWMNLIAAPLTTFGFFMPQGVFCVVLIGAYFLMPYANAGYSAAIVQLLAPPPLRGQASAIFLTNINIFSMLGPSLVGWLSERVFSGGASLTWSLAVVCVGSLSLAVLVLFFTLPAARAALRPTAPHSAVLRTRD